MNEEELKKLQRAFEKNPNYKIPGYTGNKKTVKERKMNKRKKKVLTDKQRRMDGLSRKKKRTYWKLQNELDQMFQKNSKISKKEEGKETKADVKRGLKAEGIWSNNTYKNYLTKSKTFIKFCVDRYGITRFGELKPSMVVDFMQQHVDKNSSSKTMGGYRNAILKMAEFGVKEGIQRMAKLDSATAHQMIPQYSRDEYRRGKTKGYVGYSIKDVQVMAKKAGEHYSPLHKAAVEVFGYSGPRMDEFRKIKWEHLDFKNNRIYMVEENMTKGNRPRFLEIRQETMNLLKEIKELNLHSDDRERIWGSRMTENDVRGFMKNCSRLGKRRYSGVHDFRRSMVEYKTREMEKGLRQGKLDKEKLVDLIMEHVGADPRLNPMIEVKAPKLDKNGNRMFKKGRNGNYYPIFDKTKPSILKPKYTKEELMKRNIEHIKNVRISLLLGHFRPDISSVYKQPKKKQPE